MNVIAICCDTLRADILDHTWQDYVDTPNLDELRAHSTVFTNAWAEALPTIPMRRAFYTGMQSYPWRDHVDDRGSVPNMLGWHAIPTRHTTVAEHLVPRGVMTGLISDLYHQFKPTMNFTRGFLSYDYIRGQESDTVRTGPLSKIDMRRHLPDEIATPEQRPGMAQYLLNMLDRRNEEDYLAPRVFRSASRWLEDNVENQPFYLCVESFTPHEHWDPPVTYADRYFQKDGVRDFIYPQLVQSFRPLTDEEVLRTRALYYGYITFLDRWVGTLLDTVRSVGLWDDTAILFLSDHGTELMDRTQFGKSSGALHPFTTRVNFWLRHPDESLNRGENGEFIQNTDVAPTILGLFGAELPQAHGFDVMELVTGKEKLFRNGAMTGWGGTVSMRTNRWNCILETIQDDLNPRLYNLNRDALELENVAADNPSVIGDFQARLEGHLGEKLPIVYAHRPTDRYRVGMGEWREANVAT